MTIMSHNFPQISLLISVQAPFKCFLLLKSTLKIINVCVSGYCWLFHYNKPLEEELLNKTVCIILKLWSLA